jgi:type IV pilus biogenesis protein CpaD/CtpE
MSHKASKRFRSARPLAVPKKIHKAVPGSKTIRTPDKVLQRKKYYTEGPGSTGLLVSTPRIRKLAKRLEKDARARLHTLTGEPEKEHKSRMSKEFVDVLAAGVDQYQARLYNFAYSVKTHGRKAKIDPVSNEQLPFNVGVRPEDLEFADMWVRKLLQ